MMSLTASGTSLTASGHMEDVLDVYTRPYDPRRPQVCLDETSVQLIGEKRTPVPMAPGRPACFDYEYERHGVCALFMLNEPLRGWREVVVADQRTAIDFAHVVKHLVDVHYPDAERIVLVMDNLNTHTPGSLYEAFDPTEARRLADSRVGARRGTDLSSPPVSSLRPPNRTCELAPHPALHVFMSVGYITALVIVTTARGSLLPDSGSA